MIKANNGNVEVNGRGIELLVDYACITRYLCDKFGTEIVSAAISMSNLLEDGEKNDADTTSKILNNLFNIGD